MPLTVDYPVLLAAVDNLQAGQLEDGTAIGTAIATAANRLRSAPGHSRVLILLTDGENNRGAIDPRTAAQAAAAVGVKIYTIGAGTIGMAPVPVGRGLMGMRYEYRPVEIDEGLLRDVATTTGGRYFRAVDAAALQRIYQQIDQLEQEPVRAHTYVRYTEEYRWPLAVAIIAIASRRCSACGEGRCREHPVHGCAVGAVGCARARAPRRAARALVVSPPRAAAAQARLHGAARAARAAHVRPGARGCARCSSSAPCCARASPSRDPDGAPNRRSSDGSGVDMVLALDASLSMLATDARPNRLERMKEEARRLLALSTGDRVGLLAFAGRSYILTPLTVDRGALELFLDNLDPSVVGQAGSSLSRAIRQGTDLLVATQTTSDRALVIMSDGEAFEPPEEVTAAAAHAAEAGVTVIAVGFGTEKGSTIPVRTAQGTQAKRDENGQIVTTRYTPELLKDAVTAAHGVFIDAAATDKAVRIRGALAMLRRQARETESETARRARFQLFLIPALLLVLLDSVFAHAARSPSSPRQPPRRPPRSHSASCSCPLSRRAETGDTADKLYRAARYPEAAAAYQREIQEHADSPRLEYNLGTALMQAGQLEDAVAALERAATHRDLRRASLQRALQSRSLLSTAGARCEVERGDAAPTRRRRRRTSARCSCARARLPAKWNYELASQEKSKSSSGGANQPQQKQQQQQDKQQQPGSLDKRQAEQLLSSAQREERDVQAKKQRENQPERPPAGKDW